MGWSFWGGGTQATREAHTRGSLHGAAVLRGAILGRVMPACRAREDGAEEDGRDAAAADAAAAAAALRGRRGEQVEGLVRVTVRVREREGVGVSVGVG